MNQLTNATRIILIGGSSHAGKSTLAQSLSAKLGWCYLSTDKLARHPGRPWIDTQRKTVPNFVAEHYRTLSVNALFLDVLSHYKKNVLPQVETIIHSHLSDLSTEYLVLEGSALWPEFIVNLISKNVGIKAIWLIASAQLFRNRIFNESNFYNVGKDKQDLIQKFLDRTLLYNKRMKEEIDLFGLTCIDVESVPRADELLKKCMELINIS